MSEFLEVALDAAAAAGSRLRRKWAQPRQVRVKGYRDIVTDADVAAQQVVAAVIRARFPHHAFLAEEGPAAQADLESLTPLWIVDPLDGTTNFAHHVPIFSVCIGLAVAGRPEVGVVYDVLHDELFYAERGQGAFVRRGRTAPRPVRVTEPAALEAAVIGVDWARSQAAREASLAAAARAAHTCRTVRTLGSAALGLAYVAAGRFDGYFHLELAPWDLAAAAALVAEAGGVLTLPSGEPWRLGQARIVAAGPTLHPRLLATLALGAHGPA